MRTQADRSAEAGTREKILDAAENLIIERGFTATSLRAIATEAGVNLAATHYHFGSKYGLLAAVFHRRIQPLDEARNAALTALEAAPEPLTARAIVTAFLSPIVNPDTDRAVFDKLPSLAGRIMGEPEALTGPLLEAEFTDVARRYRQALCRALPDASIADIEWRFHFLVGAMIHLMRFCAPLGRRADPTSLRRGVQELIEFAVAGLTTQSRP